MSRVFFWFSEQLERGLYVRYAHALHCGYVEEADIPKRFLCRVSLLGEEVEMSYHFWTQPGVCPPHPGGDWVLLGEGVVSGFRPLRPLELSERAQELGVLLPGITNRRGAA